MDQSTKSTNQSTSDSLARKKPCPTENSTHLLAFFHQFLELSPLHPGEKKQQNPWVSVLICWSGNLEFKAIFILILVAQPAVGIEQLESEWHIRKSWMRSIVFPFHLTNHSIAHNKQQEKFPTSGLSSFVKCIIFLFQGVKLPTSSEARIQWAPFSTQRPTTCSRRKRWLMAVFRSQNPSIIHPKGTRIHDHTSFHHHLRSQPKSDPWPGRREWVEVLSCRNLT